MSRLDAGLDPEDCVCVARSLRLAGYATSIRLETAFWSILDEIAAAEGTTTARYLAALYQEALARDGEIVNFTALLRVTCTRYLRGSPPDRGQEQRSLEPAAAE